MPATKRTPLEMAIEHADRDCKAAKRAEDYPLHLLLVQHYSRLVQMHAERMEIAAEDKS